MPIRPDHHTARPRLELRGVVESFRTAGTVVHAVRGNDASIAVGETVALLGPNGAGKSTTIEMLLGLIAPDSGTTIDQRKLGMTWSPLGIARTPATVALHARLRPQP